MDQEVELEQLLEQVQEVEQLVQNKMQWRGAVQVGALGNHGDTLTLYLISGFGSDVWQFFRPSAYSNGF